MNESFVFHADFIDHLPNEYVTQWTMYTVEYGIFGIEPEFDDALHAELWRKIKDRIDSDKETYNKRLEYLKEYREQKKLLKHLKHSECSSDTDNIQTDTLGVSDSVSVSEFVSEFDSVSVSDSVGNTSLPDRNYPSQKVLSNKIFTLLKDAGLPCNKGNEINFYMQDYANALRYLHSTPELNHIHSDDLVGAVENYIKILNDPDSFITSKMNFFSLVKSKMFYNLLPQNFDATNYKDFKKAKTEKESSKEVKAFIPNACPQCSKTKLYWSNNLNRYICDSCKAEYSLDAIVGDIS